MGGPLAAIKGGNCRRRLVGQPQWPLLWPTIRSCGLEPISNVALGDEQATIRLGQAVGRACLCGDVIALFGAMGCGKTVLARAIIQTLTSTAVEVPSPTFTLVQAYGPVARLGCMVHHFDLFRIESPGEALELGIDDIVYEDIAIIEWPDRLGPLLPKQRLDIHLATTSNPGERQAVVCGSGDWRQRLREVGLA